jgi:hypothetical protein
MFCLKEDLSRQRDRRKEGKKRMRRMCVVVLGYGQPITSAFY